MAHSVVFAPEAETDLVELYEYIAGHGEESWRDGDCFVAPRARARALLAMTLVSRNDAELWRSFIYSGSAALVGN